MNLRQKKKKFVNQYDFIDSTFPSMRKYCIKLRSAVWNLRRNLLCK